MTAKELKEAQLKLHDEIKEHPFWITFDAQLFPSVFRMMSDLYGLIIKGNPLYDSNPHLVLLYRLTHDFNCNAGEYKKFLLDNNLRGMFITVLQTYLSNMHNVIEGRITDNPVQYLLNKNGDFFKYVTVYEDSKYRVVLVKDRKSVEGYIQGCKKLLLKHETFMKEHSDPYGWRIRKIDFLRKEIELIENGNTTTQAIIIH